MKKEKDFSSLKYLIKVALGSVLGFYFIRTVQDVLVYLKDFMLNKKQ